MKEYLRIGQISRPHGVHGELKLMPLTDDPKRFYDLTEAFLECEGAYAPVCVQDVRVQADAVLLRLTGCDSREEAEKKRGLYLCVDRAHAAKLPEGRYFVMDLLGCRVTDTTGRDYGRLTDIYETGANDVYVVRDDHGVELQVPALKKLLREVDIEGRHIVFDAAVLEEVGLFAD